MDENGNAIQEGALAQHAASTNLSPTDIAGMNIASMMRMANVQRDAAGNITNVTSLNESLNADNAYRALSSEAGANIKGAEREFLESLASRSQLGTQAQAAHQQIVDGLAEVNRTLRESQTPPAQPTPPPTQTPTP